MNKNAKRSHHPFGSIDRLSLPIQPFGISELMDSSLPPTKRRRWQSVALVLVGMFFFGMAIHLAFTTPVFDRAARFVNGEELTAIVTTLPSTSGTRRTLVLKLADGNIVEQEQSFATGFVANYPDEKKRLNFTRLSEGTAQFPTYPYRYSLAPYDQDEVVAIQEFEFPVSPAWISESIFVGSDAAKVYSIDVSSGVRSELLHQFPGLESRVFRLPNSKRFVCVNTAVPSATRINGQTQYASLLEVDESGQLRSVWSSELFSEFAIEVFDGTLFYFTPEAKSVVCLDPQRLAIIAEHSFPSEMANRIAEWQRTGRGTCSISIRERVLSIIFPDEENCHYLLSEMKRIPIVDKFTFAVPIQEHDDLLGFGVYDGDLASVKVMDLTRMQEKEKWSYQVGRIDGFEQRDGKFFFTTSRFGITADVLDVRTGKVLFHRVPYKSLVWLLPLVVLGSTLWSWQVVRWSQRAEVAGWAVASVLSLMYLSVLLTHLTHWKYYQQPIVIHQYVQGYFIAALSVSYAWMVWGKGRWFVRCLPLFIITVVLILLARWMLNELSVAVEAVVTTLLVSVFSLPLFIGMRWWGLGKSESAEALPKIAWRLPMRDLFIVSTVAAILLAAALPLIKGLRVSLPAPQFLTESLSAVGTMLLGFGLAVVCCFKRWRTQSLVIILTLAAMIVLESLYEFATSEPLFVPREYFTMVLFRIFGSAVLLFFFLANCCLGASSRSNSCRV